MPTIKIKSKPSNDCDINPETSEESNDSCNDQSVTKKIIIKQSKVLQSKPESKSKIKIVNPKAKSKKNKDIIDVDDYEKLPLEEQILLRPGMYIGSVVQNLSKDWFLDLENLTISWQDRRLPDGLERIFLEIFSNASDNIIRSRKKGIDPGRIDVTMDSHTISIRNEGIPIPVKKNKKWDLYGPELVLGNLLTSSNYNKEIDREGAGQNGYGAKLTNIFSKSFHVEVGDNINNKHYTQLWEKNMTIKHDPQIEDYQGPAFVKITYTADLPIFGYDQYPEEAFNIFARHAYDVSYTCRIGTSFNGINFQVSGLEEYANNLFMDKNKAFHYQYPSRVIKNKQPSGDLPNTELCLIDTPKDSCFITFVNGLMCRKGGIHLDAVYETIKDPILALIGQKKQSKQKKKKSKSKNYRLKKKDIDDIKISKREKKEKPDQNKNKINLTVAHIKSNVSVILNCFLNNTLFESQSKTELKDSKPLPSFTIPKEFYEPIKNWDVVWFLYAIINGKNIEMLQGKGHKAAKHTKANFWKTKNRQQASLFITEGDSAAAYPKKWRSMSLNGNNYFGIYPARGKLINSLAATIDKLVENKEIKDIIQILGLEWGANYDDDEMYDKLYYGRVIILTDADEDGKHIAGLILAFFFKYFPSLLARGFLFILRTPCIRVTKGKIKEKFYSVSEFNQWAENNEDYQSYPKSWTCKYFKGLGTSSDANIKEDLGESRLTPCFWDIECPSAFHLVFDKQLVNQRKQWIANWSRVVDTENMNPLNISDFLRHEVVQFSIANLERSIPKMMDGLKPSQRKLLYHGIKKFGKVNNEMKMTAFGCSTSNKMNYHHGEVSLYGAIIGMGQDFVGSNNMPYFEKVGQFGGRFAGGKDASNPRYLNLKMSWWIPYIFSKKDKFAYDYINDEGVECEPNTFYPIIPTCLINGCYGIGTGTSTFVPNYNPLDLCLWIKNKIKDKQTFTLKPWYRGFTGTIEIEDSKSLKNVLDSAENTAELSDKDSEKDNSDNESESESEEDKIDIINNDVNTKFLATDDNEGFAVGHSVQKKSMVSKGIYEINEDLSVSIKELPLGVPLDKYVEYLDKLKEAKYIIDYDDYSTSDDIEGDFINIRVKGMVNPSTKKFNLISSNGVSNMYLLNLENKPIYYSSADDIMESFYAQRGLIYEKRRQNLMQDLKDKILKQQQLVKFITMINDNTLTLKGKSKPVIMEEMTSLGLDSTLLSTNIMRLTQDSIDEINNEIEKESVELKSLDKLSWKDLWLEDIDIFENAYRKYYKEPKIGKKIITKKFIKTKT